MPSQYDDQFKLHIPKEIQNVFRRAVSRKWGIDKYGLLSHEIKQLMLYYDSVDGRIPSTAYTHNKSPKQKQPDILTPQPTQGPKIKMTTAIVSDGGSGSRKGGGKEYYHDPQYDPILREWLLTKGIDITNLDSTASHIIPEDLRVGELPEPDLNRWKKNMYDRLIAKRRRKDNDKWRIQAGERDKELEPELRKIKQHLNHTDSIKEHNHVHVDQIYKAWTKATGKRDRQRVFKNRLHEYIDSGYFVSIDDKHTIFRAEDKFMNL